MNLDLWSHASNPLMMAQALWIRRSYMLYLEVLIRDVE